MILKKIDGNLFDATDTCFVQCISADFGMAAGIAVQFNANFDMKKRLLKAYKGNALNIWKKKQGFIVGTRSVPVINLVTKERYWHKPTYEHLRNALLELKAYCTEHDIKDLSMPLIGCGLDGLSWPTVEDMLQDTFENMDITIRVYTYKTKGMINHAKTDSTYEKN